MVTITQFFLLKSLFSSLHCITLFCFSIVLLTTISLLRTLEGTETRSLCFKIYATVLNYCWESFTLLSLNFYLENVNNDNAIGYDTEGRRDLRRGV